MATFDEVLARVKREIREVEVDAVAASLGEATLIDVREHDEVADGHIPGALCIARGVLDMRIAAAVPDLDARIVLYCAGGARSAFAARSLTELGYRDVVSMAGGFAAWKERGHPFEVPRAMSSQQMSRYSRHMVIPEVGDRGQRKLLDARVFMLGAGGLGSPAALYLAAAGIGELGIVDDDLVDRSNLQRQVLHSETRIGMRKVDSAEQTLRALNPDVKVTKYPVRLTPDNARELLEGYDVVLDGGDNFRTRYLINDVCVPLGIPVVHGSVYRFEGQVSTFAPGAGPKGRGQKQTGPCYRCLYPEPPPPELAPSCQEAGVLGVIPGIVGTLQALEVLKLVLGVGEPLIGRLLTFDGLAMQFRELRLPRDPACPTCG